MYTSRMEKASGSARWWDWSAIVILFVIVETCASRLVATNWTDFLFLGQTVAYIGYTVGVSLGYSSFKPRRARWISFLYMILFLPLQWTLIIDQTISLEEQFLSLGGRLLVSYSDFFARRPVNDPLFFITLITLGFWIVGASAGFQLVRRQNYLAAVAPSAIALLVVQSYDSAIEGRVLILAFYALMALLLLGRLHHLANRQTWKEKRVFLSPDNNLDLTSIMSIAAGLIILVSWTSPASLASLDSAAQTWNRLTKPWRDFTQRMENAVSALEGIPVGRSGEFYGPELNLGQGFDFSDAILFTVQAPDLPSVLKPPRYYWRGRTYDHFENGQWYTTGTSLEAYSPDDPAALETPGGLEPARFLFSTRGDVFSLLYAPAQPVWISRQGSRFEFSTGAGGREIVSWFAHPALNGGEVYQVDAVLNNPNTKQLREAGINYPAWVSNKYLQLPDGFSPRIKALAAEIVEEAEAETPYEMSVAVTRYLRNNIEYVESLSRPPRGQDPLEWMLFENKQGYCVYYASAEILMLRSLGIPARLAAGFAQGEDNDENLYTVRRENAHAWPEVYFPGIGWVEFEPTGGQPSLTRPAAPDTQQNTPGNLNQLDPLDLQFDRNDLLGEPVEDEVVVPVETPQTFDPRLYLIPLFIALASLGVFLSLRYSIPERIPVFLRVAYEKNGAQTPAWIIHWERWVNLSPVERAFETVNFSLRLLDQPMPVDATPIERARKLTSLLPRAKNEIASLLDEHQTSLYTSRSADILRARRSAFRIRWQTLAERFRYILEGKPIESP
jgi:transglutaminase-like putative cysteine protease